MPGLKQIIIEQSTTILALSAGLVVFKRLSLFYYLLLLQVLIYWLIDTWALTIGNGNGWIYNLFMPIESAILFIAAQVYFKAVRSKRILFFLFFLFLSVFIGNILYLDDFLQLASYASVTQGILLLGIYCAILFFQFMEKKNGFHNLAVILASAGMVFYYGVTIPYLCALPYLNSKEDIHNLELFQSIVLQSAHLRYFLIAIAFLLARHNFVSPYKSSHD